MTPDKKIVDIIKKAHKLGWLQANPKGYPLMQLSEVEKCILAVLDEDYMKKINLWVKETEEREKRLVLERMKKIPDNARLS